MIFFREMLGFQAMVVLDRSGRKETPEMTVWMDCQAYKERRVTLDFRARKAIEVCVKRDKKIQALLKLISNILVTKVLRKYACLMRVFLDNDKSTVVLHCDNNVT